jgi:HEAT repeat protein
LSKPGGKPRRGKNGPARARWLLTTLAAISCAAGGCAGFWDEVTSKDFKFENLYSHPDPLVVLRDSHDGDKRAKALRALCEPAANGGTQEQQEVVVKLLTTAAVSEPQALCRMAAIHSLRTFRDARAAKALEDAYYRAGSFDPATATIIRCQALQAMGECGNPAVVETLVKALREPPVEGPDVDKQQKMDERIAAARSLGRYQHYQATAALVDVLRKEQDVALRDRAHRSLVSATGKELPPDAAAWSELLESAPRDKAVVREPGLSEKILRTVGWSDD